jgi:hypothetical protein
MHTWKLEIEYEGTRFRGWQIQHNANTIQGELQKAAYQLFSGRVEIGEPERAILATKSDLGERTRLSCQIRLMDNLHVQVVRQASVEGLDAGNRPTD